MALNYYRRENISGIFFNPFYDQLQFFLWMIMISKGGKSYELL